ncbi:De-etiolated protein 1 Det1-domain-containing protein [Phascolomyces articulosus]|uniref:De-etiolated protein 1 Det1-domain-containing protein n=1 Tax=Phascolomyces articulosus TaxID=60185 RepID=A0AAD5JSK6_9FUNG|nr:De-etiolated protein 1 Det1-domain-containing protein [Phascolomyces articulosus]
MTITNHFLLKRKREASMNLQHGLHARRQGDKRYRLSNGVRKLYSYTTPNYTLYDVNMPTECINIRRFTPDGKMILVSIGPTNNSIRQETPYELKDPIPLNNYAFYIIEIENGQLQDYCIFEKDYIHLTDHAGVSIVDDLFSVLCIQTQIIHVFQINDSGTLKLVNSIGQYLYRDDQDVLTQYTEAERRYQTRDGEEVSSLSSNETVNENDDVSVNNMVIDENSLADGDWDLAVPEEFSSSLMTARALEELLENTGFYDLLFNAGEDDEGEEDVDEATIEDIPYCGFTQALLSWGFGKQFFYGRFEWFLSLKMWRTQFIGHRHLLIKMTTFPPIFTTNNAHEGMKITLFIIFNIAESRIEEVFDNTSTKVADILLDHGEWLHNISTSDEFTPFLSAPGSSVYDRYTLGKKFESWCRPEKNGSYPLAMQRLSLYLPRPPDTQPNCPYFDLSLFSYPERMISCQNWTKGPWDLIKFYSRETTQFKFMIDARTRLGGQSIGESIRAPGLVPPPDDAKTETTK